MAQEKEPGREQWSSQFGFILAAIGSAVGLGNIWRFPGQAYNNGGGAFMLPYLLALITAGIPVLLLDYSLGHRYRGSAPATFRRLAKKYEALGWFQVAICVVIITYYAVILAWGARYFGYSVNMAWGSDTTTFFTTDFLQLSDPGFSWHVVGNVFWPLLVVWICAGVIIGLGVTRGVERANRVFMPLLVVMFLALVIRALFLPGAAEGIDALFTPNWHALLDANVWIAAYSQIFFSLSVAFGIMLTYSSYLPRKANPTPTAFVTGFANSSFELLAGLGVFATLGFMAYEQGTGIDELEGITGVALSFMTFPKVISMMPGGPVFGMLFFGSLVLAGFTSLLSLLQVVSSALQEKFRLNPARASVITSVFCGVFSVILFSTSNGLNALDVVDNFVNNIGVVSSAIIMTLLVGLIKRQLSVQRTHLNSTSTLKLGRWWDAAVGILDPVILIIMFVATVISLITTGYGDYDASFVAVFGWGTVVVLIILALGLTKARWHTNVDAFDPEKFYARVDAYVAESSAQHNDKGSVVEGDAR